MEMKLIVGIILVLIILAILVGFVVMSHGLFETIIEWFKNIVK